MLAFGWIDSQQKGIDAERFAQRSPRRPGTPWSELNKARLRKLAATGRMTAIRANSAAARVFRKLPREYVRIRVGFIDWARDRPGDFSKRLRHFLTMTAKGKTFGYVGEYAARGDAWRSGGRSAARR